MDIKEIINEVKVDKKLIDYVKNAANKSSNSFWWLKLIEFAEYVVVLIENREETLSGDAKKKIVEEILYPIYDKIKPKKLSVIDAVTFGMVKKILCSIVIEAIVWCYNNSFGKKWIEVI